MNAEKEKDKEIEILTRWIDPTIEEKDKEIERLNNIIKEVREYIEKQEYDDDNWVDYELLIEPIVILEILDKENI